MNKRAEGFEDLSVVTGGASVVDIRQATAKQLDLDKLRTRVLVLRDQMGEAYFELGRLLHRINKDGLYSNWNGPNGRPYQTFEDYVEHEVDFAFRKAKYLMAIWWWFAEELGDKTVMEKIKEIGWTKAAMLVGVVDGKNVDLWVSKAKESSVRELGDEARRAMEMAKRGRRPRRPGEGSEDGAGESVDGAVATKSERGNLPVPVPAPARHSDPAAESRQGVDPLTDEESMSHRSKWTILLDGEQRVNVEGAIDVASKIAETEADGKGFLLDLIATSFLAMHAGTVGNNDREHKINFRNEFLRSAERVLGLDLIAIDRATNRPLFGKETIDRLAMGASDASQS